MKKIHLADPNSNSPLCMVVFTGKKYELTDDASKVTCKRCLTFTDGEPRAAERYYGETK